MNRILIVEDDDALAAALEHSLTGWGFETHRAENLKNVVGAFVDCQPNLVLMDLMLPCYNGCYWCGEIRKLSQVPVVFLSSAADNMNIIMAMSMGGDDFIPKPVDPAVLVAKLQAVLRRAGNAGAPQALEHRGVVLNLSNTNVSYDGRETELTKNEFRILQTLMEHHGKIVTRDTLMTRLWHMDAYVEENTLTVNVTRLRRKLAELGLEDFIRTKVGMGYMIE